MWPKTKLEIYEDSLHAFNVELATARQTFFSNHINSNLNTCTLFATVERLTTPPQGTFPVKCSLTANAMSLLPSSLRRSIISERRLAHPQVMRRSHRFDRNFKNKWLCLFSKHLIVIFLKEIVQLLKSSTFSLDTLPTSSFKSVLNGLEADLLEVVNTSLLSGTFPNSLKTAVVKPFLKKHNLDNTMLSNYRSISNLPFIGKIIEKVVFNQLNNFLNSNGFLDNFQSSFRAHHSTETVLFEIINNIRFASDSGQISVLVLLDLSAAFDTVDHNILLQRLENWVGLSVMVLYNLSLLNMTWTIYVSIGEHKSKWTSMTCGVPQGSIIAPFLFSLYAPTKSNNEKEPNFLSHLCWWYLDLPSLISKWQ